jgi:hypothetical protein
VTVKQFGDQRTRESNDAVKDHARRTKVAIPEVLVLCRPGDAHEDAERRNEGSASYLGSLSFQDVWYHFIDILEWIAGQLLRMSADARQAFYLKLNAYVSEPNTAESVKRAWQQLNVEISR